MAVKLHPGIVGHAHGFLRRRQEGRLQRLEEDLFVDPLLRGHLPDDVDQFFVHRVTARSRPPAHSRPPEEGIETRLRQQRPRDLGGPTVRRRNGQAFRPRSFQAPSELEPPVHGLPHPAPHVLAHRPRELAVRPELSVETGGGYFQVVALRNQPRDIEHVARLVAQALAVDDPRPAGLVDEEPQDPAPPLTAPLQIDQLERVCLQYRGDDGLDLGHECLPVTRSRVHLHPPCPIENKKVGGAHFGQNFSTGSHHPQGPRSLGRVRRASQAMPRALAISRTASRTASRGTFRSARVARSRISTTPSLASALPMVIRMGTPTRSASLNLTPARSSRSSMRTSNPAPVSARSIASVAAIWAASLTAM